MRRRVSRGIAPTEKSPASSSHKQDVAPKADRLGDVVSQACLSVLRMVEGSRKDPQFQDSGGSDSEIAPRESLSGGY